MMYQIYVFVGLSILGVIDSLYLLHKSTKKVPMVCPLNSDCHKVVNSKWNKNDLAGV